MRKLAAALTAIALLGAPAADAAEENPVQLSLFDPVQIFANDTSVRGIRLSLLYGYNHEVRGIDLGLVNRTSGQVRGVQFGAVGFVEGDFTGWQDNWAVNMTEGVMEGLQTGVFNRAHSVEGVQFGILNMTENLNGLQIGILNIARAKETLPILPIVNWSF